MDKLAINPRLCYRGVGTSAAAASRFVGLFNATPGNNLLVVWDFSVNAAAAATPAFYNNQGKIGSKVMDGAPMYQGEAIGGGQIFNGTDPASPTFDYQLDVAASQAICWWRDTPFAIIQPGWMLNCSTQAGVGAITVSLIWQIMRPDDLVVPPLRN